MEAAKSILTSIAKENYSDEFYNYGDYYIKLNCNDNEELNIICYNMEKLDGIRYEIKMNIQQIYNLSNTFNQYNNIKDVYDLISEFIKEKKCNIELNSEKNLNFSFIIADIKRNNRKIEFILVNKDCNNTKEYINILSNEIRNLRKNNNMKEIKEIEILKEEIENIKKIISKYEICTKIDNVNKFTNENKCLYCGRVSDLRRCICCNKYICKICIINNKNNDCQKGCFLLNNNLNKMTSFYHISKFPLSKNFEAKIHYTKVDMIRVGITFDPNIINEKNADQDSPKYNIYYLSQSLVFYNFGKGWINYSKLKKEIKEGDDLIINVKDGNLNFFLNGEFIMDSYPIEKEDIDKKDMYLLIHRRNKNSECELKYIYELINPSPFN